MKVTASTTDDEIQRSCRYWLEKLRDDLSERLEKGELIGPDDLTGRAMAYAETWGEAEAETAFRNVLKFHTENATTDADMIRRAAEQEVYRRLLNSPGDTWSGRGNDGRRAQLDGFRKAAHRLIVGF